MSDSKVQSEVCCASQWDTQRRLLCLTVGYTATFAVHDNTVQGEVGSACQWRVNRGLLCLKVYSA